MLFSLKKKQKFSSRKKQDLAGEGLHAVGRVPTNNSINNNYYYGYN